MAEKILDSTRAGTTRNSCYLASIYGNDSLELVWKNGQTQVQVQGGSSSSVPRKTPSCDGYSINPSHAQKAIDEDVFIAKSGRLSTSHNLFDFPDERDSELYSSQPNSHQSNDQTSCQLKESKLTGGPHQTATRNYCYLCTSSTKQCQCLPSAPDKKPRMDSNQTPTTNSLKQDLGKVNYFSNVLKPSLFLKSTYQENSTTLPTNINTVLERVEEIKASKVSKAAAAANSSKAPDHDHSVVIDSSIGSSSHGIAGLQRLKPLKSLAPKPISFVTRSQEIPPDQQSETVGHHNALRIHGSHGQCYNQTSKAKGKAHDNNCYDEPLPESSSVCSPGSDNDEETEDVEKHKLAWKGTGVKRSRSAELRSSYERKRGDKINKKMRVLKELIPNCNKKDKASMLDDAIEYLKTLKFQLQIMSSMGLCMPLMMLPIAAHHMINAPHLPHLMGAGMVFRPGSGMIPCSLPQFPIAPLPGINDIGVHMFGFPNQVPLMPISLAPFIPMGGNHSSTATKLAENQASARTHVLMDRLNMQQSKH